MKKYYARFRESDHAGQSLVEHLTGTASLAKSFADEDYQNGIKRRSVENVSDILSKSENINGIYSALKI